MKPWGLRDRLLFGNIALVAVSLLLFAVCARFVIARAITGALDDSLRAQAQGFSHRNEPPGPYRGGQRERNGGFGEPHGPPPGEEGRRPPPPGGRDDRPDAPYHPVIVTLMPRGDDPHHDTPYSSAGFDAARAGATDLRDDSAPLTGETLRVFSAPLRGGRGEIEAVVQTVAPRADTDRAVASVTAALLALVPAVVLIAGVGGTVLTRRALLPVGRLADAAATITPSRLSERLPETGGDDEFDRLTRQLNRSLARLDEAFARQKRFAADASHELRTPLAVIKAATSLLADAPDAPLALRAEALREADHAADRANRLIGDLLYFARGESGALPVRMETAPLQPIIAGAVREARAVFGASGEAATIHVSVPNDLRIATDPELLARVLTNLLGNALRHTSADGSVSVGAAHGVTRCLIVVRDTGSGIAPEHLARLGEPFYRPDAARSRDDGGSGLGIAISRAILKILGGSLSYESTLGIGTSATVMLPAALPLSPSS